MKIYYQLLKNYFSTRFEIKIVKNRLNISQGLANNLKINILKELNFLNAVKVCKLIY